jgi:hypothetical protein
MLRKVMRATAAAGIVAGTMIPAGSAFAVYGDPGSGDPGSGGADQGGGGTSNSDGDTLPFTGGDIAGLTLIGGGLALGGVLLARQGRRKAAPAV